MGHLEDLAEAECVDLLRSHRVGRLALTTPGGLRIYPVNYAVHGSSLVVRTLPYGEVAQHASDAAVAFSVDELDEDLRSGWTVLAVGTARRVEDPEAVATIRRKGDPGPWAEGQRTLYLSLAWDQLTGRRLHPD